MRTVLEVAEERLEQLLAEGDRAAQARERTAFDDISSPYEGRIVIYGAGGLGQRTIAGLRANGAEPLAFADRNAAVWGRTISGVDVLSPENAIRKFGSDAVFVVAVWNPSLPGGVARVCAELRQSGCRRVAPFISLFWKHADTFLPYYLWDLPSRVYSSARCIRDAFAMLTDSRSRLEFVNHLELRLTGNFDCLNRPDSEPQYFPRSLFRVAPDECFVDCGAYDGDTLCDFADWTGGSFRKAIAFEADPVNFGALQQAVAGDRRFHGRVDTIQAAVGQGPRKVRFAACGLASAAISDSGDTEVDCVSLDDSVIDAKPTYIKMDIEGAELDALDGARVTLRRHNPVLAVCTYHAQDHLWRVPLKIRKFAPQSMLVLRPYCEDGFDLVCYAIPPDRAGAFSREDGIA
jgi:FkbM family methyltransferase